MATTPSLGSSTVGFTTGALNTQINDYITNNPTQVGSSILGCIPKCDYTATDLSNLRSSLDNILTDSINRESKRMYNSAIELRDRLDQMNCLGDDTCIIFNSLVESAKDFVNFYYTLPTETVVVKNPNYLNN